MGSSTRERMGRRTMMLSRVPRRGHRPFFVILLRDFEPRNIYNAGETGIYYRALPDGILTFSTDHLSGSKKAKDRITALVAVNMDGSDKRLLLIVRKSRQLQCFMGVQQLPLPYSNNKNAWMTGDLFCTWLADFERDMAKKNRFIVFVVDNCAAHPKDSADNLPHIKIVKALNRSICRQFHQTMLIKVSKTAVPEFFLAMYHST